MLAALVPLLLTTRGGVDAATCSTDGDCSLNGLCKAGSCVCFAPWSTAPGDALGCARLDTLPGPKVGCYGQAPHVPSWGGNAILFNGEYHLFVSTMTEDCGLSNWGTNMQIDHAVSPNATGPYVKADVALPAPATNPQAIVDPNGTWWLFHIGDAHGVSGKNCSGPPPPPGPPPAPPRVTPSPGCGSYGPPPPGFTCHTGSCGAAAPGAKGPDCGTTLGEPALQHGCGVNYNSSEGKLALAGCAKDAAALCAKNPKCQSFSLDPKGWGRYQTKLFGSPVPPFSRAFLCVFCSFRSCFWTASTALVTNVGWDTFVKSPTAAAYV